VRESYPGKLLVNLCLSTARHLSLSSSVSTSVVVRTFLEVFRGRLVCYDHAERSDNTVPTVGFTSEQVPVGDSLVTLYDVGGGARIRDIWRNYFADVHGLVYVVDSSERARLAETRSALQVVFKDPLISGKPGLM